MLLNVDVHKLLSNLERIKSLESTDTRQEQIIRDFYIMYNEAYRELVNSNPDVNFHEEAISTDSQTYRYTIFNSFIENCTIDYIMWGLGSGNIRFAPYQALFDYIYGDVNTSFNRGKVLKDYIETEIPEIIEARQSYMKRRKSI